MLAWTVAAGNDGEGPKTSSKDVSFKALGGGEANAEAISVLPVRRKNGLLADVADRAGLATCVDC